MSDYIKMWLEIIENMSNDNTYKLAWGRALLEIISELKDVEDINIIHFDEISKKMLKYYWNQVFFFKLKQGPARVPVIVQETEKCIEYYINKENSNIPVWFDYAENVLKKDTDFYNKTIKRISTTLTHDVSWRFQISNRNTLDIYTLDKSSKTVTFTKEQVTDLKEYVFVLSQLLNYRWAQLLERFNNSPRIASKVRGISDNKIRRNNLKKYKDVLLSQMKDGKVLDFYSGDVLEENDISVDHVIPWSFMYSDDIWNLVITSRSNNSSKSNSIPSEEVIRKLEERNREIAAYIDEKYRKEMEIAIENDYVNKFYLACKM